MYKVFFKDRTVFFTDNIKDTFRNNHGLFYRYENREQLNELVNSFNSFNSIKTLYIYHDNLDVVRKEFISLFNFIRASGGLVYNSKGDFLVIKRNGVWDLPKGKAEQEEDSGKTAIREVSEECGLKSLILNKSIIKTYHTYQISNMSVLKETEWFEMRTKGSEKTKPQIKENITETRWLKRSEINLILQNTYPSITDILRTAGLLD